MIIDQQILSVQINNICLVTVLSLFIRENILRLLQNQMKNRLFMNPPTFIEEDSPLKRHCIWLKWILVWILGIAFFCLKGCYFACEIFNEWRQPKKFFQYNNALPWNCSSLHPSWSLQQMTWGLSYEKFMQWGKWL